MMKDKICEGDKVDIYFDHAQIAYFNAEVLYMPCATGDSWRFRLEDGGLLYVGEYSRMILKENQGN